MFFVSVQRIITTSKTIFDSEANCDPVTIIALCFSVDEFALIVDSNHNYFWIEYVSHIKLITHSVL